MWADSSVGQGKRVKEVCWKVNKWARAYQMETQHMWKMWGKKPKHRNNQYEGKSLFIPLDANMLQAYGAAPKHMIPVPACPPHPSPPGFPIWQLSFELGFAFLGVFHTSLIDCDSKRKNCYSGAALASSLNNKICACEVFIIFHVVYLASLWSGSSYISWIHI